MQGARLGTLIFSKQAPSTYSTPHFYQFLFHTFILKRCKLILGVIIYMNTKKLISTFIYKDCYMQLTAMHMAHMAIYITSNLAIAWTAAISGRIGSSISELPWTEAILDYVGLSTLINLLATAVVFIYVGFWMIKP